MGQQRFPRDSQRKQTFPMRQRAWSCLEFGLRLRSAKSLFFWKSYPGRDGCVPTSLPAALCLLAASHAAWELWFGASFKGLLLLLYFSCSPGLKDTPGRFTVVGTSHVYCPFCTCPFPSKTGFSGHAVRILLKLHPDLWVCGGGEAWNRHHRHCLMLVRIALLESSV